VRCILQGRPQTYIQNLTRSNKTVRSILQGLPQTYVHSLGKSNKSSKMYLPRTSTKVYS